MSLGIAVLNAVLVYLIGSISFARLRDYKRQLLTVTIRSQHRHP